MEPLMRRSPMTARAQISSPCPRTSLWHVQLCVFHTCPIPPKKKHCVSTTLSSACKTDSTPSGPFLHTIHYTLYAIHYVCTTRYSLGTPCQCTLQYKLPGARYTPYLGTLYTFTLPGYARRVHYEYTLVIRVCT